MSDPISNTPPAPIESFEPEAEAVDALFEAFQQVYDPEEPPELSVVLNLIQDRMAVGRKMRIFNALVSSGRVRTKVRPSPSNPKVNWTYVYLV